MRNTVNTVNNAVKVILAASLLTLCQSCTDVYEPGANLSVSESIQDAFTPLVKECHSADNLVDNEPKAEQEETETEAVQTINEPAEEINWDEIEAQSSNDPSDDWIYETHVIEEINDLSAIRIKANEAYSYVQQKGMNDQFCILIDMSYNLYTRRLLVWNFQTNSIMNKSVVCHGDGGGSDQYHVVFSNEPGSHCTSEGKYKIGERGYSNWGTHVKYLLHGLEATNSNALRRTVVLHSYNFDCEDPSYAYSEGCPMVCMEMMDYLDDILKHVDQPVLLWIFKSK